MTKLLKILKQHKVTILLIAILLLASFLRLYRLSDYMTFLGDEGRDLIEVKKILSGNLVFLGPRSSAADFYYGPVYFYFITPFLWLFQYDPVGPAVFIALVGIATVYLIYYVGKELLDEKTGLFAAALYTVSPLVIAYSRSSWNPNPLPFVSLLLLFFAYIAIKNNSWKLFLLSGFCMGIAMQLQYLALFLGVILFLFTLLGLTIDKRKRNIGTYINSYTAIVGGIIIGWSPFLAFEIKHGFPNLRTIFNYIFFGSVEKAYVTNSGFIPNVESVFFKLFARLVTRFPPPEQININENFDLRLWQIAIVILGVSATLLIFRTNILAKALLLVWLIPGVFLFGFYKNEIYDYYLGFMFPLPFLLVGNLLTSLYENKQLKLLGKLSALFIFFVLFLFNLDGNPFKNTPNRQKDQVKMIAEFVLSKTVNKPYNFALLTKGNSDHAYKYYLETLGHTPTELKNETIDPQRKTVTNQLLVVCEDPDCHPLGSGLWEVAGFGQAEIAGEWRVSVVKVIRLVHYPRL